MAVIAMSLAALGCPANKPAIAPARNAKPFEGVTLKLGGTSEPVVLALAAQAQGWASRTGATVVVSKPGEADVVFVPPALIGQYAERDDALPVPPELKTLDHPGQWVRILPIYRDRLAAWAGEPRAIPLAGDGAVLVINRTLMADPTLKKQFQAKFGRPLPAVPATWEDLAEITEACEGLTFAGWPLRDSLDEFFRVAACADRPALTESDLPKTGMEAKLTTALISFTHEADTGAPRLTAPGFATALAWRDRIRKHAATGEAVQLLADDKVVCARLSLPELGRLPKNTRGLVAEKFQIAPLPGSRTAFDPRTEKSIDFAGRANAVPYYSGGWFGVVRKSCQVPAAAFDLLADLAGPSRSLERLSDPVTGFGPFRSEQFDSSGEIAWSRYGFDAARTHDLAEALRLNANVAIVNPAFGLRGPDAAELQQLLEKSLESPDGLKEAQQQWRDHDAKNPAAKSWRRHAAGLP